MMLRLNRILSGRKCDENGALSLHKSLWTIRLFHRTKRRKRSPKEEETEAQGGENGTKMVLPLNDTLNGPKRAEYGALSSQRVVDYLTPSSHKNVETKAHS